MYMVTENYLESKIIVFYSESRPFKVTNKFLTELEVICIM
jgi:hypothetical protein